MHIVGILYVDEGSFPSRLWKGMKKLSCVIVWSTVGKRWKRKPSKKADMAHTLCGCNRRKFLPLFQPHTHQKDFTPTALGICTNQKDRVIQPAALRTTQSPVDPRRGEDKGRDRLALRQDRLAWHRPRRLGALSYQFSTPSARWMNGRNPWNFEEKEKRDPHPHQNSKSRFLPPFSCPKSSQEYYYYFFLFLMLKVPLVEPNLLRRDRSAMRV